MINQVYTINLITDKVPVLVNVSQYDQYSRTIIFDLFKGSEIYEIPNGSTVTVRGMKPDNTGFEYPCQFEGNRITFDIQPQITILSGKVPAELRITSSNEIVGSCNFYFDVEHTPLDESTVISDTELPLIEEASQAAVIAQGAAARAEAEADRAAQVLSSAVKSVNNELPDSNGNVDVVALPTGGTAGQILTKQSSTDGDADWENLPIKMDLVSSAIANDILLTDSNGQAIDSGKKLGDYATQTDLSSKQDILTASTGIDITNNEISNSLVYKTGDSIVIADDGGHANGIMSSGVIINATTIFFNLKFDRPVIADNISIVNSFKIWLRTTVGQKIAGIDVLNTSGYSFNITKVADNSFNILMTIPTVSGITNATPISVYISEATIEFI